MANKNLQRPVSWRGKIWRDPQNGIDYPVAYPGDVRYYGYNRTGINNPNYRVQIRKSQNAATGMTVVVQTGEASDARVVLTKRGSSDPSSPESSRLYRSGHEGVFLTLNEPVPVQTHYKQADFGNACATAKRIVNKRATSRRRQLMGGVVLWELKKTLQMVIRPAKSLRSSLAAATRRIPKLMKALKRSGASRKTKARVLADTYLELTFGWQPLLADTRDGATALARLVTKDALERQQFRGYGAEEKPVSTWSSSLPLQTGYDSQTVVLYNSHGAQKSIMECIYYGKFVTRLQDESAAKSSTTRLIELCGFTLTDFLPTAWEAIPWSFLVDYFTNVGDVIEAFSNCTSDIAWANEVHIQTSEESVARSVDYAATRAYHGALFAGLDGADCASKATLKTVSRSLGMDLNTYLRFSLPVGLQWLNIGALAVGARPPKPFY